MMIELKKFGNILTSREAGGEALSAFMPTLATLKDNEEIKIDFQGVSVLTASWADEFIRPLIEKYGKAVSFINDSNPSVRSAMQFANPKLDFSKMTVFNDVIAFDELSDDKIYNGNKVWPLLVFPYADKDAVRKLIDNQVEKIKI